MNTKRLDSKKKTTVEVLSGKVVSLVIGYFVNMLILPIFGVATDAHGTFFTVSLIFVTIAGVRSFVWRRFFNWLGPGFLR